VSEARAETDRLMRVVQAMTNKTVARDR